MRTWGISALSHDAALAVVNDGELEFAGHSERYSRIKNDPMLHPDLISEALFYGVPDHIAWYERPNLKRSRHVRAGQWREAVSVRNTPKSYLRSLRLPFQLPQVTFIAHHTSHAAAGFATSGFKEAAVIVGDAIGEWRTFSIMHYRLGLEPRLLHRKSYPHSLGLLYSAFTRRCGFRPNEDEYIVMGLAALGKARYVDDIYDELIVAEPPSFRLRINPHRGIGDWRPDADVADLAASIQRVTEDILVEAARWARRETGCGNLVFMGGIALNCVVNSRLASARLFDQAWIFPNPGDAGSSVGAAAACAGQLRWRGPYLGTDISGDYPVADVVTELLGRGVVGVASGRAEFGPRALGNRSLLADPSVPDMQDVVNGIKGREPFRPFAPIVRQEIAHELFDLPVAKSPYMQYVARCRELKTYPAIAHVDGTSRVQTVGREEHPGLYAVLENWEKATGHRVLLNTSLNSKGEPLVNTRAQALAFGERTGVRVLVPGASGDRP